MRQGFGKFQAPGSDGGQRADLEIVFLQRANDGGAAFRVGSRQGGKVKGQQADVAFAMLEEAAQLVQRDGAFPGGDDLQDSSNVAAVSGGEHFGHGIGAKHHGVAAQLLAEHHPGQRIGAERQQEDILDIGLVAGLHQTTRRREAHLLVGIFQGAGQEFAGNAAARFVVADEGQPGHGLTPARDLGGGGVLDPLVNQGEIQSEAAQAVAGAAGNRALKSHEGFRQLLALGFQVAADDGIVRTAGQKADDFPMHRGPNGLSGGGLPAARAAAGHLHHQQDGESHHADRDQAQAQIESRPFQNSAGSGTHLPSSRLRRATSSMGLNGFTT